MRTSDMASLLCSRIVRSAPRACSGASSNASAASPAREVFHETRMRESWRRTGYPGHAITEGLATTGSVITAAAAIMIVVFGAFVLSPDRMLQQFGFGLAVAILVDAFVVHCLVLPAIMAVLGKSAWWLPARGVHHTSALRCAPR